MATDMKDRCEAPSNDCLGGGYVIDRVLGRSPRGTVARARAAVSGRPVVVKILADDLAADEVVRARFFRAAALACRLSHPNVVRVFDAGDDGQLFVVMEYVDGDTLARRLAERGTLSPAETLTLATHLAAGLAHAHANGVVHGALDPHRIWLGGDGVARIGDFGYGRVFKAATRAVDPAGDVYSLGTVLREAGGDNLPPGLAALVDATLAPHGPVRPSAVDVFHQVLTMTSTPGVLLAAADASVWTAAPAPA